MSKNENTNGSLGELQVNGRGEIEARPDVATIRLAVITEAEQAESAAAENAEQAQRVIERIQALNIPAKDIQTTGLIVNPVYRYDDQGNYRRIVGYRAENAVSVKASMDMVAEVFDAGIGAGANEVGGIVFGLRDERAYRDAAVKAAVKAAHHEASVVSAAMGLSLLSPGEVRVEPEGGPILFRADLLTEKSLTATPVMPGTLTISAQVHITYRYRC